MRGRNILKNLHLEYIIVQFYCYFTNQILTINGKLKNTTGTIFYVVWAEAMSLLYMALAPTLIECDNWCEKYPFPIPLLYYLWSNYAIELILVSKSADLKVDSNDSRIMFISCKLKSYSSS